MKKLVIDREQWFRGKGPNESALLREDSKMCCVGFYCLQILGLSEEQIQNKVTLVDMGGKEAAIELKNARQFHRLYDDNDTTMIESARENLITKDFESIGVKVEFIN